MAKDSIKLLCLGNPLLDIQANTTPEYLEKYGLKPNDAILTDEKHMSIFPEALATDGVVLIAGGAAQNAARGAAYMLAPETVAYVGSVGRDVYSEKLLQANEKAGVLTYYMFQDNIPTGKCAALITGKNRSLCTDLAAANHYKLEHLKQNWDLVEQAKVFYVGGFHFTVSPPAIRELGSHAAKNDKIFAVNLSAPFIPLAFKDALDSTEQYWDYLIGNESEASAYAEAHDLPTRDIAEIAKHIAALPKANLNRPRTVVLTQGLDPTVVAIGDAKGSNVTVQEFPVHLLDQNLVKDTNGAGDAFAGGFVAGLVENADLAKCIDMGQWLAKESLQLVGPSFPTDGRKYTSK